MKWWYEWFKPNYALAPFEVIWKELENFSCFVLQHYNHWADEHEKVKHKAIIGGVREWNKYNMQIYGICVSHYNLEDPCHVHSEL